MTFRARVLLALGGLVVASLTVFAFGVRREMAAELTRQYGERVDALARVIRTDLTRQDRLVADRLATISEAIARDNRFRRGVLETQESPARDYVLDYAAEAMRVSGLDILQIQDETGRIVSSGHFRNEFDLLDPALPRLLQATAEGMALARARTAEGGFLVLARLDSVRLGRHGYTVAGGVRMERALLGRVEAEGMSITLVAPGDSAIAPDPERPLVVSELALPYIETVAGGNGTTGTARIVIRQSAAPLRALVAGVDRWFAVALAAAGGVAVLLSLWLAARISKPLGDLAERTAGVDLDRLDVSFETDRTDEIGTLARFLDAMTQRLRASVRTLRDVERRVAVGDLARQVNHDVKNGLVPVRNVFRHLAEVARDNPAGLAEVFRERQPTLQSAVDYLERLAATYASLTPRLQTAPCDVNATARHVAGGLTVTPQTELKLELDHQLPRVNAEELALRRIFENLLRNAVESLDGRPGTVMISTARSPKAAGQVRVVVSDTGPGMNQQQLEQAFSGFYTTKPGGTGLGLSIVRRLVLDLGGSLGVETEPGRGTRVTIDLPAA
jgi:signal transduction histidine kinase